jgi:D-glycero-alpha-D-manno-heptose 1-phosphate guanylyltransferase
MSLSPSEAIVLAGGAGTRLRGVLPDVPKVLAPIGGRPFLHRLLERLAEQGIQRAVLATGYAADIVEAAAETSRAAIDVVFSREQEPLGTGGAIAQAFDLVRGPRVWVMNGDSYCDVELSAVAEQAAAAPDEAWLVAVEVEDASRYGTLELDFRESRPSPSPSPRRGEGTGGARATSPLPSGERGASTSSRAH